jgi:formylglycine-generating enzyme required for sulfatase activity
MPHRFIHVLLCAAAMPMAAIALAPRAQPAAKDTPPAKLEPKNFTQKVSGFRTITDGSTKKVTKYDMSASFDMVYIPGGKVTVGSPESEKGRQANEGPRYKAKVGSFWMQKCEVTWDQWDIFWFDENFPKADSKEGKKLGPDAVTRPTNTFVPETYDHGREGHPAMCMTHHAAMMYCEWLESKTGRKYRLPTEAEWEYAARAGKSDTAYFFGDDPKQLPDYAWFAENSKDPEFPLKPRGCTHKVGTRKPNPFGLHDMYGNVWEWSLDQHDPKTYESRAKTDLNNRPVNVPTDEKWSHVVRGGSWADKADKLRSSARRVSEENWMKDDPQEPQSIWWLTKMDVIGFRVVLAEEEQPELVDLKPKVVKR